MKICFIEAPFDWADRPTKKTPNLGIMRLASILKNINKIKINDLSYYDFTFLKNNLDEANHKRKENILNSILDQLPDANVFAFSVMQPNYQSSVDLAKLIKKKYSGKCVIIFGGPSVTDLGSGIINSHQEIDFLLEGFCEHSFSELIKEIEIQENNLGSFQNSNPNFKKLSSIPNLIFKTDRIIVTNKKYPPTNWDNLIPIELKNKANYMVFNNVDYYEPEYINNHHLILAGLGCAHNCDFCSIVKTQPKPYERDNKYIIKELKQILGRGLLNRLTKKIQLTKKKHEKISIQLLHQNFLYRLVDFMKILKRNKLIKYIKEIGFNCSSDIFLKYYDQFQGVIKENPDVFFTIYIGIENFDELELKRIGKQITSKDNISATQKLIELDLEFSNFKFILSFIGFNELTTIKNMQNNINAFKTIFVNNDYFQYIDPFFRSPLRAEFPDKQIGGYPDQVFKYPKDKKLTNILTKYYEITPILPQFEHRKILYYQLIINPQFGLLIRDNYNLIWAELNIIEALIDNNPKKARDFAIQCKSDFKYFRRFIK